MGKINNLTGQKYNHLYVKSFIEVDKNLAQWMCSCDLCGEDVVISSIDLTSGNKKSCGCLKRPNLIGKKYTKLTVIKLLDERKNGQRQWKCECDCGNIVFTTTVSLTKMKVKSCGCIIREDLSGKVYGFVEVLSYSHSAGKRAYWLCKCVCGNLLKASASNLRNIQVKSCGCKTKDLRKETVRKNHGVENVMQSPELALKQARSSNKSHVAKHWFSGEEIVCQGSWEKKTVEYFNKNKVDYLWQVQTFLMPDGRTYRPDCYLPNNDKWIEIKGYFWEDAEEKWNWFCKEYPNSELWDKKKLIGKGIL